MSPPAKQLTRRALLTGWGKPRAQTPPVAPPPRTSGAPLPRVIAWLEDAERSAPPPRSTTRGVAWLRPPGALDEREFLERCTRCHACEQACLPGAIRSVPERYGAAAGTPWIDPARAPCQLCSDWPCIAACTPAALALEGAAAMGTAHLVESSCLNRLGSPCSVCVEHCPVPGALVLRGALPVVEDLLCTGCGLCAHACPAPARALIIAPREHRRASAATVKVDP